MKPTDEQIETVTELYIDSNPPSDEGCDKDVAFAFDRGAKWARDEAVKVPDLEWKRFRQLDGSYRIQTFFMGYFIYIKENPVRVKIYSAIDSIVFNDPPKNLDQAKQAAQDWLQNKVNETLKLQEQ